MRQIVQFLQEVKTEFKNIAWPKRDALIQLTFVVISISIIISLILGGFDFIFTQGINLIGLPAANQKNNVVPPIVTIAPASTASPTIIVTPTKIIKK